MAAFWLHYNRPATRSAGSPKMTVHYRKQCLLVDGVVCGVPIRTRNRSKQPRVVMVGDGVVRVRDGVAYITEA